MKFFLIKMSTLETKMYLFVEPNWVGKKTGSINIKKNYRDKKNKITKIFQLSSKEITNETKPNKFSFKETSNIGKIIPTDLHTEMSRSYMEYAMSVIYGRALPDIRDGLKPVHRRILFAMHELGLSPDTPFRKCARVVGEVLGKYHPHGDNAVYDALVRMAQEFSMRSVFILGHGNFGSVDHDPPAAMRYTECKISPMTQEIVLKDIEKKTSDFVNNFDGSCKEPSILPSVLPTLLLNGSNGIAVGMATNIPPHNLTELTRAVKMLIKNPGICENELIKLIPGPDFPTGGSIIGLQGCSFLYKNGQGSIMIRAKTHFESLKLSGKTHKTAIVVTELPYQVNKTTLITKIAEMVNDRQLEGITDLRDESDRDGIRLVIELKKDTNKEVILNNLFKKTPLQTSLGAHMLGLVGKQPETVSLKELILLFIQFRKQTIRRSLQFQLTNSVERIHIIDGLILTLCDIEFILAVIRQSKTNFEAKSILMEWGLTQVQSDAILNIQLRRLTKLESSKLTEEQKKLSGLIKDLKSTLVLPEKINQIIETEMNVISRKYGMPRRTNVVHSETGGSIDEIEMVDNYKTIVMVTKFFIKRMVIETFESQTRGTRGKKGLIIQENDEISHFFSCNNHDSVLCISSNGIAFSFKSYRLPVSRRTTRGVALSMVLPSLKTGEIASIVSVPNFYSDKYLILLTQNGMIKKTPLIAFKNITARGLIVIGIKEGDKLGWVRRSLSTDKILISSQKGKVIVFLANHFQLRSTGRSSKGVKSMTVDLRDKITDMDIIPKNHRESESFILMVTSHGFGKRTPCDDFRVTKRGGKGVIGIKLRNNSSDFLISMRYCEKNDEVLLSTVKGTIVRQKNPSYCNPGEIGYGSNCPKTNRK
mmetsp:Transcript_49457/g.100945  ORF Transcript_49457/g.100945 Transcript_49457/m.100945 type:complete len:876 (-) Transcript_49457:510-3137(-)